MRGTGAPKRNGARHCCQAPLRRAKDLPVFVTLISQPEGPKTRPRSWLTSSGVAFHHGGPKTRFVVRIGSRESVSPQFPSAWPEGFRDLDVPRPFLGWVPSTQPCLPGGETALVKGSTSSSGASCRLVRKSACCVIAPKGSSASSLIPSPAGGDRSFRRSPYRLAVAGLLVGGDFRPDHNWNLHNESESRQAENEASSLWITGISGVSPESRAGIPPIVASRGPIAAESPLANRV